MTTIVVTRDRLKHQVKHSHRGGRCFRIDMICRLSLLTLLTRGRAWGHGCLLNRCVYRHNPLSLLGIDGRRVISVGIPCHGGSIHAKTKRISLPCTSWLAATTNINELDPLRIVTSRIGPKRLSIRINHDEFWINLDEFWINRPRDRTAQACLIECLLKCLMMNKHDSRFLHIFE